MTTPHPSRVSDAQLLAAARTARNVRQLLLALDLAPYGGNYEVVRRRLLELGVDDARWLRRARIPDPPPDVLAHATAAASSYAELARALGFRNGGGTHDRVKALVAAAGCDTSHFLGQAHNRGTRRGGRQSPPLESVLVPGALRGTGRLKRRLVDEGVLFPECSACRRTQWCGRQIPLELDHVNGDRTDNRLENLRLLCPNCHALTPTYRGRNIGREPREVLHDAAPAPRDEARARLRRVVQPRPTA
jgi:hypothetical protein